MLAYSEETGLQYGAMGMLYLKPFSAMDPGGQIDLAVIGTTRGQKRSVLTGTYWLANGTWRVEQDVEFTDWPAYYWEGGNHPQDSAYAYRMKFLQSAHQFLRKIGDFRLGLELDLEWNQTTMEADLGLNQGGRRMGAGYSLQYDTRDHENWPRRGVLAWWKQAAYSPWIGSEWTFVDEVLDLRAFIPGPWQSAWGFASYWEGVLGDAPMDRLAAPDGTYRMRGLEKGRLSDRQQWVLQAEWRLPLFWRFYGVAFAEAGKVAPNFGELLQEDFHPVLGIGGRMSLNTDRKVHVRGDLSWVDGGIGLTVYYKESF